MFSRRPAVLLVPLVLLLAFVLGPSAATAPTSATIAGDLQSELGCPGDWAPDCAATDLTPTDGVFVRSFTVPAGNWQYKAALNHSWDENYGAHTAAATTSRSPATWRQRHVRVRPGDALGRRLRQRADRRPRPGSFQSELGCSGDWQPDCLRSGSRIPTATASTRSRRGHPARLATRRRSAINAGWDVNYGEGGVARRGEHPLHRPAPNQRVIFTLRLDGRTC